MPPGPCAFRRGFFRISNFRKRSETHYTRLNVWRAISKQKRKPALPTNGFVCPAIALNYRYGP
jgi:hypothetical protein